MKTVKKIFTALLVALVVCVPAVADNGCENDDNDAIVAELALCSTHAYNIGATENPTGEDRELMRDVIAMKTTLITQQMYKQYEQMESMLRRLKTQLEKAVLTTGLEAKGASSSGSSSGGSSFKSDDKYVVLAGTENCMQKGTVESAVSCIQSNVRIVMNAVNAGSTTDARKQLEKDLEVASVWGIINVSNCSGDNKETKCKVNGFNKESEMPDCQKLMSGTDKKKNTISSCANALNVQVGLYVDNRNRQAQQKKQ